MPLEVREDKEPKMDAVTTQPVYYVTDMWPKFSVDGKMIKKAQILQRWRRTSYHQHVASTKRVGTPTSNHRDCQRSQV